jgi:hypothetical protein
MPGIPLDPKRRTNRYLRLTIASSALVGALLLLFLWRWSVRNLWSLAFLVLCEVMFAILPAWQCAAELRRRRDASKNEIVP